MTKKYPKSDAIQDESLVGEEAYVAWGDDLASKKEALSKSSESMEEYIGIDHSTASRRHGLDYSNLSAYTLVPGCTRIHYDFSDQTSRSRKIKGG